MTKHGAPRQFVALALAYDGDDCLLWPFASDPHGYGNIWVSGVSRKAHQVVCEQAHGPRPSPKHDAAHSCGRGGLGCVTKRHLAWKTRAENMADTIPHGTRARGERHGAAKLTAAEVRDIRSMNGTPLRALADRFGVSFQSISAIQRREQWAWLDEGVPS